MIKENYKTFLLGYLLIMIFYAVAELSKNNLTIVFVFYSVVLISLFIAFVKSLKQDLTNKK